LTGELASNIFGGGGGGGLVLFLKKSTVTEAVNVAPKQ